MGSAQFTRSTSWLCLYHGPLVHYFFKFGVWRRVDDDPSANRPELLPLSSSATMRKLGDLKMSRSPLLILFVLLSTGAPAQWLNFPTPGTPRTRDGKPNLSARAPRAANGKPDLSGVWHVEPTSLAEMKRLLGDRFDTELKVRAPGMELDNISKY